MSRGREAIGTVVATDDSDWRRAVAAALAPDPQAPTSTPAAVRGRSWAVPLDALAGAADGPGLWLYDVPQEGSSALMRIGAPTWDPALPPRRSPLTCASRRLLLAACSWPLRPRA